MRTSWAKTSRVGSAFVGIAVAALLALFPAGAAAERVTIVRDSHAEPHIQARSAAGAAYGLGYAQMEDQAAYILEFLAQSTGRSAELLGPECLPACFRQDQLTHLFRVPESAREKYGTLPRSTRRYYEAFADAINDYIADHPDQVPDWAVHVTPQDVLASVQYRFVLAEVVDASETAAAAGAAQRTTAASVGEANAEATASASNGFVLDGSKTASGKPMIEGDPHLPFEGPSEWYQAQLSYPGTRIQGVTFRGLPGIAIGSNGHVAWTHTANHGNQNESDAYIEQLPAGQPNSYRYGGAVRPMMIRRVPIEVQTSPGVVQTITPTFRYTIHGPVISDPLAGTDGIQPAPGRDQAISATISQFEQVGIGTQLLAEAEARNLGEFRDALRQNQLSGFNILAADEDDIFYASGSRSGILNPGLSLRVPRDGTDPYETWQGILPFDQLPQATNPPSGYYQNANNAPWYSAPGQIFESQVPYYLRGGTNGTRSRRQKQLLDPLQGADLARVGQIGLDNYVEVAPSLKALLAQAAASSTASAHVKEANAFIQTWDNRAQKESTVYPLFATWVRGLDESVLGFKTPEPPPPTTTFTAAQKQEARRAMNVAYNGMKAQYGSIAVRYGDVHTFTWGSLTAGVNGGDADIATVRLTNCKGEPGTLSPVYYHPCRVRGGSSFMYQFDMASDRMTSMRPVSASDDPSSPHYTDNARDYVADRYRSYPVRSSALEREEIARKSLRIPGTEPALVTLRSERAKVGRRGHLRLRVRCSAKQGERCRGKLKLTKRVHGKRRGGSTRTISRDDFSLRRGKGTVRAKLTRRGRHALERDGRLRAKVIFTVRELGDRSRERDRVTLVAKGS